YDTRLHLDKGRSNWRTYLFVLSCAVLPAGRITKICMLTWETTTGTGRSKKPPEKASFLTRCTTVARTKTSPQSLLTLRNGIQTNVWTQAIVLIISAQTWSMEPA